MVEDLCQPAYQLEVVCNEACTILTWTCDDDDDKIYRLCLEMSVYAAATQTLIKKRFFSDLSLAASTLASSIGITPLAVEDLISEK